MIGTSISSLQKSCVDCLHLVGRDNHFSVGTIEIDAAGVDRVAVSSGNIPLDNLFSMDFFVLKCKFSYELKKV